MTDPEIEAHARSLLLAIWEEAGRQGFNVPVARVKRRLPFTREELNDALARCVARGWILVDAMHNDRRGTAGASSPPVAVGVSPRSPYNQFGGTVLPNRVSKDLAQQVQVRGFAFIKGYEPTASAAKVVGLLGEVDALGDQEPVHQLTPTPADARPPTLTAATTG
jgi:hypothetical protein